MTITLDEATEKLLQRHLASGRFANAEALLTHALTLVDDEAANLAYRRTEILEKLEKSIAQADQGEGLTEEQMRSRMVARRLSDNAKVA